MPCGSRRHKKSKEINQQHLSPNNGNYQGYQQAQRQRESSYKKHQSGYKSGVSDDQSSCFRQKNRPTTNNAPPHPNVYESHPPNVYEGGNERKSGLFGKDKKSSSSSRQRREKRRSNEKNEEKKGFFNRKKSKSSSSSSKQKVKGGAVIGGVYGSKQMTNNRQRSSNSSNQKNKKVGIKQKVMALLPGASSSKIKSSEHHQSEIKTNNPQVQTNNHYVQSHQDIVHDEFRDKDESNFKFRKINIAGIDIK